MVDANENEIDVISKIEISLPKFFLRDAAGKFLTLLKFVYHDIKC